MSKHNTIYKDFLDKVKNYQQRDLENFVTTNRYDTATHYNVDVLLLQDNEFLSRMSDLSEFCLNDNMFKYKYNIRDEKYYLNYMISLIIKNTDILKKRNIINVFNNLHLNITNLPESGWVTYATKNWHIDLNILRDYILKNGMPDFFFEDVFVEKNEIEKLLYRAWTRLATLTDNFIDLQILFISTLLLPDPNFLKTEIKITKLEYNKLIIELYISLHEQRAIDRLSLNKQVFN